MGDGGPPVCSPVHLSLVPPESLIRPPRGLWAGIEASRQRTQNDGRMLLLRLLLTASRAFFQSRSQLALDILALRHQLALPRVSAAILGHLSLSARVRFWGSQFSADCTIAIGVRAEGAARGLGLAWKGIYSGRGTATSIVLLSMLI